MAKNNKVDSPSRLTPPSLVHINTRRTLAAWKGTSSYANLLTVSSDHAFGRSPGGLSTKIHQLVDGHGLPALSISTAGQDSDSAMFAPPLENLQVGRRIRPHAVLGGKACSSGQCCAHEAARRSFPSRPIGMVIGSVADSGVAVHGSSTRSSTARTGRSL